MSQITLHPEGWLVGAFLVLFGVAVAAAMPAVAGAVRSAVAEANAAQGKADAAPRVVLRVRLLAVRSVEPKVPDSHDVLPADQAAAPAVFEVASIFLRPIDDRTRILQRGFRARAPPHANA